MEVEESWSIIGLIGNLSPCGWIDFCFMIGAYKKNRSMIMMNALELADWQ